MSVTLNKACQWTFSSHSKLWKKRNKKVIFQKQQLMHQQTIEIKQLKQLTIVKGKYSSSEMAEFHPLLRASRDHATFSTVATVSFTHPSGKKFLWKNAQLTRNLFLLLFIVRNEENTGYGSVLGWWVVGWGYWLDKEYVSFLWLSDVRAAGDKSHKTYGVRKILELCCY